MSIINKDKAIGSINIASYQKNEFNEAEKSLLQMVGYEIGSFIARLQANRELAESEEKYRKLYEKYRRAFHNAELYKDLFAHDINNIIQVVKSGTELLGYLPIEKKNKDLKMIKDLLTIQTIRAAKLVSNIQYLSYLDEKGIEIQKVELLKIISDSIKFITNLLTNKPIEIYFEKQDDEIHVLANDLLQDIIENMLLNSVKYSKQ